MAYLHILYDRCDEIDMDLSGLKNLAWLEVIILAGFQLFLVFFLDLQHFKKHGFI